MRLFYWLLDRAGVSFESLFYIPPLVVGGCLVLFAGFIVFDWQAVHLPLWLATRLIFASLVAGLVLLGGGMLAIRNVWRRLKPPKT